MESGRCDSDSSSSSSSTSETEEIILLPDTSRIDRSDFALGIKRACGDDSNEDSVSVTSKLQKRMVGQPFTQAEKCFINNSFKKKKICQEISIPDYKLWSGSFSEDGKIFLTVSTDEKALSYQFPSPSCLWLYRVVNGKLRFLKKIVEPRNDLSLTGVAFSPDGSFVSYSRCPGEVQMCSVYEDPGIYHTLRLHLSKIGTIFSLEFSSDGGEIFGISNNDIFVYNLEKDMQTVWMKAHCICGRAIRFADKTSRILFSAGNDGLCKVWDRRTLHETNPQPVGIFAGHEGGITFIDSRGDERHLITTSYDETIKLWDMRAFSGAKAVESGSWAAYRHCQGLYLPRCKHCQGLYLPRYARGRGMLEGDTSVMTYRSPECGLNLIRCQFSPLETTGQRYICAGSDGGVCPIYDVLTGEVVEMMGYDDELPRDLSWHPYQPYLSTTGHFGSIELWIITASLEKSS